MGWSVPFVPERLSPETGNFKRGNPKHFAAGYLLVQLALLLPKWLPLQMPLKLHLLVSLAVERA